jgi:RimJ/RimL family protein N-acetyltransferase
MRTIAYRDGRAGPISLEPFTEADFARLISWIDSPESLFEWAGATFTYPLDEAQLERYLRESPAPHLGRLMFKAVHRDICEVVGHIELLRIDQDQASASVCHLLVAPEARGQGISGAVLTALLARAFGELGLHRIELRAYESNPALIAYYERIGFVKEGVLRESGRFGEEYRSVVVMSMLEHEWRAATAGDGRRAVPAGHG